MSSEVPTVDDVADFECFRIVGFFEGHDLEDEVHAWLEELLHAKSLHVANHGDLVNSLSKLKRTIMRTSSDLTTLYTHSLSLAHEFLMDVFQNPNVVF